MTIYLRNPLTQIAPAVTGVAKIGHKLLRPDAEEEKMIKDAIAAGRLTQEDLNNMSVNELASKFGISPKTAAKYTTGVKSAKKIGDEFDAGEMQRIMALPQDNPERQEFIARRTGTQTPQQRQVGNAQAAVADNEAKLSAMELEAIKADLASGDPLKIEAAQARLARRQTKDVLRLQGIQADEATIDAETARNNRNAATKLLTKYGPKNLFAGINDPNNQNPTTELYAVYADPQLKQIYEGQREDYWREQQAQLQRDLASGRADRQSADIIVARKISERVRGTVGVNDIVKVIQNPELQARFHDEKGNLIDEKTIHPEEKKLYLAVKAIDSARDADYQKEVKDAYDKLRIAGKSIYDRLNNPRGLAQSGMDDAQIASLINEYNTYALQYLGGVIPSSEIPQIEMSETKGVLGTPWGKDKYINLKQGNDPLLTTKKKEDKNAPDGALADPAMQQAIDLLVNGGKESDLDAATNFTAEEKKTIKARAAALKAKKK